MSYLYTLSDNILQPAYITDVDSEDGKQRIKSQGFDSPGLFVYDLTRFAQGKVDKYKMSPAIGGVCNFIDVSKFSDRLSFIQNYSTIAVIPFPHVNLINCVGMDQKHEYLIWREKNGFFSALDKKSNLLTWSLLNGKLLYSET